MLQWKLSKAYTIGAEISVCTIEIALPRLFLLDFNPHQLIILMDNCPFYRDIRFRPSHLREIQKTRRIPVFTTMHVRKRCSLSVARCEVRKSSHLIALIRNRHI